jgi:thiol-disulfide isomerase/thioredoxin
MRAAAAFTLVATGAVAAGAGLYLLTPGTPSSVEPRAAEVAPAALYAATFRDAGGEPQALGRYAGRPMVLNFWATWCAPCREEMPAFTRLQRRWGDRVQFVGLAQDDPGKVRDFAASLGINYPLWTGGDEVGALSRRLGNAAQVLPFTVLVAPDGRVVQQKVGAYKEPELDAALARFIR